MKRLAKTQAAVCCGVLSASFGALGLLAPRGDGGATESLSRTSVEVALTPRSTQSLLAPTSAPGPGGGASPASDASACSSLPSTTRPPPPAFSDLLAALEAQPSFKSRAGSTAEPSSRRVLRTAHLSANTLDDLLGALSEDPSHTDRQVRVTLIPPAGQPIEGRVATIRLYTPEAELVQELRGQVRDGVVCFRATPDAYLIEAQAQGFASRRCALTEDTFLSASLSLWLEREAPRE